MEYGEGNCRSIDLINIDLLSYAVLKDTAKEIGYDGVKEFTE